MFQALRPPRAKPRVMMHGTDFGYDGDRTIAHMECQKCGHDGSWWNFANDTEAKRGAPCPVCNKEPEAHG
ncbi:hypothetical protein [Ancylobacter oerskovii]|uniref:Uncharacterized protein n=1 Tax=Ancylobacter oerskovii TaxID=459519 RepID=A0ABW4Z6L8_9HYPH|nr:hypothetical protein [Ancylobacter oerskovii]MBS7545562.1 hypothetical protein [Ancylobacter oerskovii]